MEREDKFFTEDGRRAHRIVKENDSEVITEVLEEEVKPLILTKRIVEKKENVVTERRTETIHDGDVVDVKVESIYPSVKMELREHLAKASEYPPEVNSPYATKDELVDATVAAVKSMLSQQNQVSIQSVNQPTNLMRLTQEIDDRVEKKANWTTVGLGILAVILSGVIIYVKLIM